MNSINVHVRWMIRRDFPAVLEIEERCFEFPWTEDDFFAAFRQKNVIGQIAEVDDLVQGFVIFELHKNQKRILNLAVNPDFHRRGIGRRLVEHQIKKLGLKGRTRLILEIRESNLPGQLFFRAMGFKAVSVLCDWYENDESAYAMEMRLGDRKVPEKEVVS